MKSLSKFGCGDSGCIFGPPRGLSTNGGCRCFLRETQSRDPEADRFRYQSAIREARKYEEAYFEMFNLLERTLICLDGVMGWGATNLLKDINRRLLVCDEKVNH